MIDSINNSRIKYIRSLKTLKFRNKEKKFLLEGPKQISDILKNNHPLVDSIIHSSSSQKSRNKSIINKIITSSSSISIPVLEVSNKIIESLTDTVTSQGLIAVIKFPKHSFDDVSPKDILLYLEDLQDPGNLGSIFRTAKAANLSGLLLSPGAVSPYSPKTIRASSGSLFDTPVITGVSFETLKKLKTKYGFKLFVANSKGKKIYSRIDYTNPFILAIGNEGHGLSENILDISDETIRIPMGKSLDSLNAGVTFGIIIYEALRQRNG